MEKNSRIYVAGHNGLVGSAIIRRLNKEGFQNILTANRNELNLLNQAAVNEFFKKNKIEYIFLAAARVGGIYANSTYPADFLYENLVIATNVIHAAHEFRAKKLLYLGSSCIYPKACSQPMKEEDLLSGPLEPSNEAYAIAKIAGLKLCKHFRTQYGNDFIAAMPTNLYGPHDNFHPQNSHVLPALIRRFHEAKIDNAKEVVVWGTGWPIREMLYVDDLASALLLIMEQYSSSEIINVGTGKGLSIRELAEAVKETVGFKGSISFDITKPDGTPRKVMQVTKIKKLGWAASTPLKEGLARAYQWALENNALIDPCHSTAATSSVGISEAI